MRGKVKRALAASGLAMLSAGAWPADSPARAQAPAHPQALSQEAARPVEIPPDTGHCAVFPFALQVDMDVAEALSDAPPAQLLPSIRRLGIDVLRVPVTGGDVRPANPLLAALPVAARTLLDQAGFADSWEGRAISRDDPCCGLQRDTVLVRENASAYTLLHEVLHLLLVPSDGHALRADVELRFATALRRLVVYQRRIYEDPWRLLQAPWRRDILSAQRDVAELLYDRLRIGQSQEAIVEAVLATCVDERSPYFDAQRRAEGRRYGTAMVNNAVDVFNTLHDSLVFGEQTVTYLHAELTGGRTEPPTAAESLGAEEARAFVTSSREIRAGLEGVRREIEALKRRYGEAVSEEPADAGARQPWPALP